MTHFTNIIQVKNTYMIKEKFGQNAVDTINKITSVKLRQILGD